MRRALAVLLASGALAACGQGVWLSRQDAINHAQHEKAVTNVTRREAKLMTWPDFTRVAQVSGPGVDAARPPGRQRVWVVAVSGDVQLTGGVQGHWAIYIYNAVTGALIGILPPIDPRTRTLVEGDWPPYWNSFPDSG